VPSAHERDAVLEGENTKYIGEKVKLSAMKKYIRTTICSIPGLPIARLKLLFFGPRPPTHRFSPLNAVEP
jgi:hypothetical protein